MGLIDATCISLYSAKLPCNYMVNVGTPFTKDHLFIKYRAGKNAESATYWKSNSCICYIKCIWLHNVRTCIKTSPFKSTVLTHMSEKYSGDRNQCQSLSYCFLRSHLPRHISWFNLMLQQQTVIYLFLIRCNWKTVETVSASYWGMKVGMGDFPDQIN